MSLLILFTFTNWPLFGITDVIRKWSHKELKRNAGLVTSGLMKHTGALLNRKNHSFTASRSQADLHHLFRILIRTALNRKLILFSVSFLFTSQWVMSFLNGFTLITIKCNVNSVSGWERMPGCLSGLSFLNQGDEGLSLVWLTINDLMFNSFFSKTWCTEAHVHVCKGNHFNLYASFLIK